MRALQATKSGKSNPLVSVKTQKAKRKASPEPTENHDDGYGDKGHKKSKKTKRDKKR
jgi:N-acetyltransferase 10